MLSKYLRIALLKSATFTQTTKLNIVFTLKLTCGARNTHIGSLIRLLLLEPAIEK